MLELLLIIKLSFIACLNKRNIAQKLMVAFVTPDIGLYGHITWLTQLNSTPVITSDYPFILYL